MVQVVHGTKIEGKSVKFYIDTGNDVKVIPESVYREIVSPSLQPPDKQLKGNTLETKGSFITLLQAQSKLTKQNVYVVKYLHKQLLGRPAIEKLSLIKRIQLINLAPGKNSPTCLKGWEN